MLRVEVDQGFISVNTSLRPLGIGAACGTKKNMNNRHYIHTGRRNKTWMAVRTTTKAEKVDEWGGSQG